jgi:large subunit ribosomal protein L17
MFRNMVTSLFKYERIQTTDAKAKELRGWADHIITLAKRGDLHARRQALSIIREKDVVHKLFENAGKRFGNISSGYTRVIKIGVRSGDAAPMSLVELVTPPSAPAKSKKKKTTKPAAKAKPAAEKKGKKAPKAPKAVEPETAPVKEEAPPKEAGGAEEEAEKAESTEVAEGAAEEARSDEPEAEESSADTDDAQSPEPEKEK